MSKKDSEKRVTIQVSEVEGFWNLKKRLKNLAPKFNLDFPSLVRKILADFCDQNETK